MLFTIRNISGLDELSADFFLCFTFDNENEPDT
jgi:hypothetical protein